MDSQELVYRLSQCVRVQCQRCDGYVLPECEAGSFVDLVVYQLVLLVVPSLNIQLSETGIYSRRSHSRP